MNLIGIGFSFVHHGKYSGYDQLLKTGIYEKVITIDTIYRSYFRLINGQTIFHKILGKFLFPYFWPPDLIIFYLYITGNLKNKIVHLIYGENMLGFAPFFIKNILVTIHQPKSVLIRNNFLIKKLRYISGGIITMDQECSYFLQNIGLKKVKYIPHGVNTAHFSPVKKPIHKNINILQVGNWLRDFPKSADIISKIIENEQNLKFNVICRKKYHLNYNSIRNNPCLQLFSDLDDEQYLKQLQESNLIFLPLIDFSANNAILEALSCNVNILVITNKLPKEEVSSFKSYITFVSLEKEDKLIDIIKKLSSKSNNSREFIMNNYSWEIIGDATLKFAND